MLRPIWMDFSKMILSRASRVLRLTLRKFSIINRRFENTTVVNKV
jgi:hypothetical protein